jgi:hypothetical protein
MREKTHKSTLIANDFVSNFKLLQKRFFFLFVFFERLDCVSIQASIRYLKLRAIIFCLKSESTLTIELNFLSTLKRRLEM